MVQKASYYELLRHPNWQKMRLEVMQRAGFECERCDVADVTLNVHHTYYEKGLAPWEYPEESLSCLCEPCHQKVQQLHTELNRALGTLAGSGIASVSGGLELVLGYVQGLLADMPYASINVLSYEHAQGIGHAWGIKPEAIIDALVDGCIESTTLCSLAKQKE